MVLSVALIFGGIAPRHAEAAEPPPVSAPELEPVFLNLLAYQPPKEENGTAIALAPSLYQLQETEAQKARVNRRSDQSRIPHGDVRSSDLRAVAERLVSESFGSSQWASFNTIVTRESGWNSRAQNPSSTAYGLCQFLNSTWGSYGYTKSDDPVIQLKACIVYIKSRYHSPTGALAFWNAHHWF
jgi:hypothetical protein